MRMALVIIFMLIFSVELVISCNKNGSGNTGNTNIDCSGVPKSFAGNVSPIVQSFCNQTACHEAGSTNGVGPLTNYTEVFNNRVAIRAAIGAGTMPQNTTLSEAQKNSIICWIDSGAPNNYIQFTGLSVNKFIRLQNN
jgi:hypothetical protein